MVVRILSGLDKLVNKRLVALLAYAWLLASRESLSVRRETTLSHKIDVEIGVAIDNPDICQLRFGNLVEDWLSRCDGDQSRFRVLPQPRLDDRREIVAGRHLK